MDWVSLICFSDWIIPPGIFRLDIIPPSILSMVSTINITSNNALFHSQWHKCYRKKMQLLMNFF